MICRVVEHRFVNVDVNVMKVGEEEEVKCIFISHFLSHHVQKRLLLCQVSLIISFTKFIKQS